MKIKVRLFATLRYGRDKEVFVELREGSTGMDILEKLGISLPEASIYLIDGKSRELTDTINPGDVVSIFPPVGGG